MTNEQLNRKLAELLGWKVAGVNDVPFRPLNGKTSQEVYDQYRERYPDTIWVLVDNKPWEQYVFTSDWEQIMPIALKFSDVSIHTFNGVAGAIVTYLNDDLSYSTASFRGETHQEALVRCCIHALENQWSEK